MHKGRPGPRFGQKLNSGAPRALDPSRLVAPNSNRACRTHDTQGSIGATYDATSCDLLQLIEPVSVSMPSSVGPSIPYCLKSEFAHKDLDDSLNLGAQLKEAARTGS